MSSEKMIIRRNWHGGTGGDRYGEMNHGWCLETGYYPIGWNQWRTKGVSGISVNKPGLMRDMKELLRSLQSHNIENRIYLDNKRVGGVTHYGIPTGEVLCSTLESAKELKDFGVSQQAISVIEPDGWVARHKKDGSHKIPPFTIIRVDRWIPLNAPLELGPTVRQRRTIYENKKIIYPIV